MSWAFQTFKTIRHSDGHTITLESGSWEDSKDITPRISQSVRTVEAMTLIREGVAFARRNYRSVRIELVAGY